MLETIKKSVEETDKNKIPLSTAIWAEVYESLIKDGVKFPRNFDGIGASYGGWVTVEKVLKEYGIKN
jgi:hypothetical protein